MYSEKIVCPHCNKSASLKRRALTLNTLADNFVCPSCLKTVSVEEGKKAYQIEIEKLLDAAKEKLFMKDDGPTSYKMFADIIDIDKKIESARYGRVISLFFCSTLRKGMFDEVGEIIDNEKTTIYHKTEEVGRYLAFLRILNAAIDKYMKRCKKALQFNKKYFYDDECLKLYLLRLNQTVSLKSIILEEIVFVSKKDPDKANSLKENIIRSIEEYKNLLTVSYGTTDGNVFKFERVKRNGEVLLLKEEKHNNIDYSKFRMSSLQKNKNKRFIKDTIFKRTKSIYGRKTLFLSQLIISAIFVVTSLCLFFLYGENSIIYISSLAVLGVFSINLIVMLVLFIKTVKAINKRRQGLASQLNG